MAENNRDLERTDMPPEHWTLDKKVPLALVLTIIAQTIGAVWWASKLESRVEAVEARAAASIVRLDKADTTDTDVATKLARMEEWQRNASAGAERIERKLDKLVDGQDARPAPRLPQ